MLNAGYFSNPAGMRDFSGNSAVAQVVFSMPVGEAGGVIDIDADPDNTANMLFLHGNGARDYTIWVGSVQTGLEALDRPLVLNLDLIHNSKNYSRTDLDAFTAFHRSERDGYVVSARLGDTGERGQWQLGYFYAYIETLAVNNSYAEDDWLRWGSATQTRASNFKGSEFRATWGLGTNMNLVARLFVVKGIELRSATATDKEDGTRFRFDFNWKF